MNIVLGLKTLVIIIAWFTMGSFVMGFISRVNKGNFAKNNVFLCVSASLLWPLVLLGQLLVNGRTTIFYIWDGFQHPK